MSSLADDQGRASSSSELGVGVSACAGPSELSTVVSQTAAKEHKSMSLETYESVSSIDSICKMAVKGS